MLLDDGHPRTLIYTLHRRRHVTIHSHSHKTQTIACHLDGLESVWPSLAQVGLVWPHSQFSPSLIYHLGYSDPKINLLLSVRTRTVPVAE